MKYTMNAALVVFLLLLSAASGLSAQPKPNPDSDFEWTVMGGRSVTISTYTGTSRDVVIPGTIEGRTVNAIGVDAFSGKDLTSVTMPGSVTAIWDRAFSGNQLTSVTFPDSVITVETGAFRNNRLTSVIISNWVSRIPEGTFMGNQLVSITIGRNVTIHENAFDPGFKQAYEENDRSIGRYVCNQGAWALDSGAR